MDTEEGFRLYGWITRNEGTAKAVLAGSATPYLTLDEIISLSSDPEATKAALTFHDRTLALSSDQGLEILRTSIANVFDRSLASITKDNIIVANGTSGANHLLYRALLKPGDHVVVQYPTYNPLFEEPAAIGCNVTFWRLRRENDWDLNLSDLRQLIKPGVTKMLILNNPSNPTGTHIPTQFQREIIEVAKEHDLIIHCDEIFRPLFHVADTSPLTLVNGTTTTTNGDTTKTDIPTSFIEHATTVQYDRIIVTCSLSKVYGLSGVRIGWVVTRDSALFRKLMYYRRFSVHSTSILDEYIGAEALGPRCRPGILQKHLTMAHTNLDLIQDFINSHSDQCEWVRPTAGACAFIKFKDASTGKAVDGETWGAKLAREKGVLISPASLCFSYDESRGKDGGLWRQEFEGLFRVHFTTKTETVKLALKLLGEFLDEEKVAAGMEKL